jgi:hypothetical protein
VVARGGVGPLARPTPNVSGREGWHGGNAARPTTSPSPHPLLSLDAYRGQLIDLSIRIYFGKVHHQADG